MPTDTHRRTPKHGLLHRVNFDFSASVPASISSSVRKQKITRARTPPTQAEGEEKGRIGEGERPSPTHLVWARRRRRRARRRLGNAAAAAWESRRDLAAVPRHPLPPRTRPLSVCASLSRLPWLCFNLVVSSHLLRLICLSLSRRSWLSACFACSAPRLRLCPTDIAGAGFRFSDLLKTVAVTCPSLRAVHLMINV